MTWKNRTYIVMGIILLLVVIIFIFFVCGVLYGHLLWRMKPNKDTIANEIDKIENKKP